MRPEIMTIIRSKEEYKKYLREQPYWYRKLTREPTFISEIDLYSKEYFKRTIPHKVASFSENLQMASMMISMFQAMREND
ncbi:YlbE-like family protein [Bacillus sp. DJP31]|uniref:YlbE-like family protein n=1 Tax=Bacillus sp. DJP31 TaxID=3409789 RepID=UPI003BB6A515